MIETDDGLPFIGEVAEHQYVATGVAGNGMTFGSLAALMVSDAIVGASNPWRELLRPDRKPSTGQLSLIPDTATAGSFRSTNTAVDFVKGFNVMSIVIELPTAQLTAGGNTKIGVWGTISR